MIGERYTDTPGAPLFKDQSVSRRDDAFLRVREMLYAGKPVFRNSRIMLRTVNYSPGQTRERMIYIISANGAGAL